MEVNLNRTFIEEYIFGSVLLLSNKFQIWGDNLLEGITFKQWFMLIIISKMGIKNPKIKEIAEFSGTSRQNTKRIIEQLEEKGYLTISKSKTDERALNVKLSKKTWIFFTKNEKKAAESMNELFSVISDNELNITYKVFKKLLDIFGISEPNLEAQSD